MNLFQRGMIRVLGLKGAMESAGSSYSLSDPNFGTLLAKLMGHSTHTGKPVNATTSMEVTTFWACIRIISETFGGLPLDVYERDPRTKNLTPIDHDLGIILKSQPNADMTKVEYWEAKAANLAQQGNCFSIRDTRKDGSIISLTPVETSRATVGRNRNGEIKYDINDRGRWEEFPRDKVWHVKGFGLNGLVGLSPLQYARQALGVSLASEEFQAKFFANGASPSFIVSVPQWLNETQRIIARENLEKLWGGMDNAHKARLLEGGMKPEGGTMPLKDAQFMELRGLSIQEICRVHRVPPHMVMDLSRSTNNNIEQQSLEFVMYCVLPYITRFEASISRWLLKPEERLKLVVRFNLDGLLRADAAARGELHSKYAQNGVMNRNEIRQLEGRNRVDDPAMDMYTVQTQLVPIGRLDAIAERMTKAPAPTAPPIKEDNPLLTAMVMRALAPPPALLPSPTGAMSMQGAQIEVLSPALSQVAAEFKDVVAELSEALTIPNNALRNNAAAMKHVATLVETIRSAVVEQANAVGEKTTAELTVVRDTMEQLRKIIESPYEIRDPDGVLIGTRTLVQQE